MFSLIEPPIEKAVINGRTYKVDMSFDNILSLIDMLNDEELSDAVQLVTGITMLFDEPLDLPPNEQVEVFNQVFEQLIGSNAEDEIEYDLLGNPMPKKTDEDQQRSYDFKEDAEYIYASFMQCYHMDLFREYGRLHWYKFKALLSGLHDETIFRRVIAIRTMELPTGKGTAKERERVIKMKKQHALKGEVIDDDAEYDDD